MHTHKIARVQTELNATKTQMRMHLMTIATLAPLLPVNAARPLPKKPSTLKSTPYSQD
jgi:hypothetical protein